MPFTLASGSDCRYRYWKISVTCFELCQALVAIYLSFAIPNPGKAFLLIREGIVELKNLIDNAQKLPNIPKVVQELIESFGDESIKGEEIAKKNQLRSGADCKGTARR